MSILDCFPLENPRASQVEVLKAIEAAFAKGYKNVLLDSPVGSGKSAIAVACGKFYNEAHVLTPRKSLQDQYVMDFHKEDLSSIKGRNSYPCTYPSEDNLSEYNPLIEKIKNSKIIFMKPDTESCATAPCLTSGEAKRKCVKSDIQGEEEYPCPYSVAIDTAQRSGIAVSNLHSFIFQTYYAQRFVKRPLIAIDEGHTMEDILRGFAEKKILIPIYIKDEDEPIKEQYTTLEAWAGYLGQFSEAFSTRAKKNEQSPREEFEGLLTDLIGLSEIVSTKFVVAIERDRVAKRSRFTFIPEFVGNLASTYILNYGDRRLLMSGTIYSKDLYCRLNGLNPDETCYIKIGSSFPKNLRPIYAKQEYMVDASHKMWDQNFKQLIINIKKVMATFGDVKGLIHAPSYRAALVLMNALKDTGRVVSHSPETFQTDLNNFYEAKEPLVFISPTCAEGVDFKGDRARFQMILRVPYPSTADPLMAKKVKEDFSYYNYKALVQFGQMIGRVNRSEDDFGVTVLMDSRFIRFLDSNKRILPKWLMDAVIYK